MKVKSLTRMQGITKGRWHLPRNEDWKRLMPSYPGLQRQPVRTAPSTALVTMVAAAGVGVGAGLMYLLDPDAGRRRRAVTRDRATHLLRQERKFVRQGGRDLRHRGAGLIARLQHLGSDHPPDEVLVARVRSTLGHHLTHPGAIEVIADDGEVTLLGPIFASQAGQLLRGVGRVRGVHRVVDKLERHETADNIPALQGLGSNIPQLLATRDAWPPGYRVTAIAAGLAIGLVGVVRRGAMGSVLGVAGGLLALRGTTNKPLNRLVGIASAGDGIEIRKAIKIERPVGEVFAFWSRPENFPRFMGHVLDVKMDEHREVAHWEVAGPGDASFGFDAKITVFEPDREYGWRTLPGSTVHHEGLVRFEADGPERCRIHVQMVYRPPGGTVGHAVAALFQKDPKQAIDDDLLRMKSLLEIGRRNASDGHAQQDELQ